MSKKYGIFCENCNLLLNNEDNIFGTNLGQLYHSTCMGGINHGKSTDCQPQMLFKMNLKFADTPTIITETEREIMELKNSNNAARQSVQELDTKIKTLEDALFVKDRLKDDVNKLMDCVVKLANTLSINVDDKASDIVNNTSKDKSNKQAYDKNNLNGDDSPLNGEVCGDIEHNNSNNGVLQSVQQLEVRIKTLKDALLQRKSDGNKLTDCLEELEKNKAVENTPDGGNNITQDPKGSQETRNENNLSGEQHNDTENVASESEEHHTCAISEEKQELLDLRRNCVLIRNPQLTYKNLDEAFAYVRELANRMDASIGDSSVIHIDKDSCNWYVYFRDTDSKIEFLKNRFIYEYNPNTGHDLRILDYTDCGIVGINNFQSSDLSSDTAFVNLLGLANKMGITNIGSSINHIDVDGSGRNCLTYSVRFNRQDVKNAFIQKKDILKKFPETKSLDISDEGGHTSNYSNVHNFSMAIASANVIGVAELMGLSLSTDNIKRIYVLNAKKLNYPRIHVRFSIAVEFCCNDIKSKFLKKKSELKRIGNTWCSGIYILDIETERGNIVSIKYNNKSNYMFTAMSFIGLAKQSGFSFTPDQTDRFIKLSEFISKAYS